MDANKITHSFGPGLFLLLLAAFACSLPGQQDSPDTERTLQAREFALSLTETAVAVQAPPPQQQPPVVVSLTATTEPLPTQTGTSAPSPTATEIVHSMQPVQPGWVNRWFNDTSSKNSASEKHAPGGDILEVNLYERPFSQNEMVYRPDLDIQYTELSLDSNFFYVKIFLAGGHPESGDLSKSAYGVELDMDLDGRGDYLIWANGPCTADWDIGGMLVYGDSNNNVGASRPVLSDAPNNTDSYDQLLFSPNNLQDPDAAWCRLMSSKEVQIAFKQSFVSNPKKFLWGVWADDGVRDPIRMDYNDTFTLELAGSPIKNTANYPLKELYQVDNTCRESYGFEPSGNEYGLCPRPKTAPTNPPEPTGVLKPREMPTLPPTEVIAIPTPVPTNIGTGPLPAPNELIITW